MPHANKGSRAPSHWPSDVEHLQAVKYASSVPLSVLQTIRGNIATPARSSAIGKGHVIVRRIDNPAHPLHGQMGLFASKKIPSSTHVIDYLGEVHTDERVDSDYDLSLYRAYQDGGVIINVGIDASRMGNEARFINDYRGIRARPNAVFKERRTEGGELRMSVWTSDAESIGKGDEIVVSYGKAWWRARAGQTC